MIWEISFNQNWNNKLKNKAFTTCRLANPNKYVFGRKYRIKLKGETLGFATCKGIRRFPINKVNEFISYLDTGYAPGAFVNMIKTMYKNKDINWNNQLLDYVLLEWDKEQKLDL